MRRFIITIITATVAELTLTACATPGLGWRKDETVLWDELQTDAAFKRFKKASKANQSEILTYLVNEGNRRYKECETLEELNYIERRLQIVRRYLVSGKQSFMTVQFELDNLMNKITRTKQDVTGGTIIYNDNAGGYYDFGQELD